MSQLSVRIYVSPYKPIPAAVPGWDPNVQATWPATTATLINGPDDAVLVDALTTKAEGKALTSWILEAGVPQLSSVYVTHAHADHFFGATTLLEHFPTARIVALRDVADAAKTQVSPDYIQVWNTFFPDQVPDSPVVPAVMSATDLTVCGHTLRAVTVGQSDVPCSTVLHAPDSNLVVCGDVAYNGIHMWLQGSTAASRAAWLAALDAVDRLDARTIVAGHKDPNAPDDDANRVLDFSRRYLADFDAAVSADSEPAAIIDTMLGKYPGLGNRYTLWVAANGLAER